MITDSKVVYIIPDESAPPIGGQESAPAADEELPGLLLDYLRERRRAIITELRKIEMMLGLPQSIPARKRPH